MRSFYVSTLLLGLVACREPTQITVLVSTNIPCSDLGGVGIIVGAPSEVESSAPASTSMFCDANGYLGTLVVTPNGDKNAPVGINVVAGFGRSVELCHAPFGEGCVVSRRALRFQANRSLEVPIFLEADCVGVPCNATTTCISGLCQPSACADDGTCPMGDKDAGPADAGSDAGSDAGDGGAHLPPAACGDMSGLQAGSPAPMLDQCPTRVRQAWFEGPLKGATPKATYTFPQAPSSFLYPPAIGKDGRYYFVKLGEVTSYDPATSAVKSFCTTQTPAIQRPLSLRFDDVAMFTTGNAIVACDLKGKPGHNVTQMGEQFTDLVLGKGGVAFVASTTGKVFAYDVDLGSRSTMPLGAGASFTVAPSIALDGTVVVVDDKGVITGLDPVTLDIRFQSPPTVVPKAPPVLGDKGLVFVMGGGGLYAWDSKKAQKVTLSVGPACDQYPPALGSDGLLATVGTCGKVGNGWLKIDPMTGVQAPAGSPFGASIGPLIFDSANVIFGVSADGVVSSSAGLSLKLLNAKAFASTGVLSKEGELVIGDAAGTLYVLRN